MLRPIPSVSVGRMHRAILIQTEATSAKRKILFTFEQAATAEANRLLSERSKYQRSNDFWHGIGSESKRLTGFNGQVVCDLARGAWRKQKGCKGVDGVTVKFNVPRNCKTFKTRAFHFVELGLYPTSRCDWEPCCCAIGSSTQWKANELQPWVVYVFFTAARTACWAVGKSLTGVPWSIFFASLSSAPLIRA